MNENCPFCENDSYEYIIVESPLKDTLIEIRQCNNCKKCWILNEEIEKN